MSVSENGRGRFSVKSCCWGHWSIIACNHKQTACRSVYNEVDHLFLYWFMKVIHFLSKIQTMIRRKKTFLITGSRPEVKCLKCEMKQIRFEVFYFIERHLKSASLSVIWSLLNRLPKIHLGFWIWPFAWMGYDWDSYQFERFFRFRGRYATHQYNWTWLAQNDIGPTTRNIVLRESLKIVWFCHFQHSEFRNPLRPVNRSSDLAFITFKIKNNWPHKYHK